MTVENIDSHRFFLLTTDKVIVYNVLVLVQYTRGGNYTMKKIKEYTVDEIFTVEEYEVSIDEIVEGLPQVIQESVGKRWKREFTKWGEKLIVSKFKDEPFYRLELYCKNGAIIPSNEVQDDATPHTLSTAFSEILKRLELCIVFHRHQIEAVLTKGKVIPFRQ